MLVKKLKMLVKKLKDTGEQIEDAGEEIMILMNQLKGSDIQNESNPIFRMIKGLIADLKT